jgi:hypothetical protein
MSASGLVTLHVLATGLPPLDEPEPLLKVPAGPPLLLPVPGPAPLLPPLVEPALPLDDADPCTPKPLPFSLEHPATSAIANAEPKSRQVAIRTALPIGARS